MKKFKYYKPLIGAIILAGVMIMMALRISDIASAIDAIITAFVPLIVGACMAFVLDILVVRYERIQSSKLGCTILQRRFQWHLTRHLWTR